MADLVVGAMGGPAGDAVEMLNKWKRNLSMNLEASSIDTEVKQRLARNQWKTFTCTKDENFKDVSKYVINAAQNPEFAQKLCMLVLLQSGASPPPDLFSDLASDHHSGEQKVQSHFINAFKT
ncbi:hypothetical protein Scep_007737 [Stephania cephalantha]|uniref:Uncharacterized protein n=1 Tax=Stephania cephalantha TaxID=152367 RepID=A0AAP0KD34_9MAGN